MSRWFRNLLLPGLVFQGVVIGGGYATGREIAEFFLPNGPMGGLLGMLMTMLIWSAVMAVAFALARRHRAFDYRSFTRLLLGRYWGLFEVLLLLLMVLVLSVIGAASGETLHALMGIPSAAGTALAFLAVIGLACFGERLLNAFMGGWSLLLYATYILLVWLSISAFGDDIGRNLNSGEIGDAWAFDGLRYAGYNLAAVSTVLFSLRQVDSTRHAFWAGVLAGPMGMIPAVCLFIAMLSDYPQIGDAPVPSLVLTQRIGLPWFALLFQIAVLGTLIQTGCGMVHAVNERVAVALQERNRVLSVAARTCIAASLVIVAGVLASAFGLITLIANGYGLLTFGFIALLVLPTLTYGTWQLLQPRRPTTP